jgi:hypothetical protein
LLLEPIKDFLLYLLLPESAIPHNQ